MFEFHPYYWSCTLPSITFIVGYFGTILYVLVNSGRVKRLLGCLDNHHYQQLPHLHHSLMALQQIKIGMLGQRQKTGVPRTLVVTGVVLTPQPQLGSGKVTKLIEATLGYCFSTMLQFIKIQILNNFWWCYEGSTV